MFACLFVWLVFVTESQNAWSLKGPLEVIWSNISTQEGLSKVKCPGPYPDDFWNIQGWRFPNNSWQPVPVIQISELMSLVNCAWKCWMHPKIQVFMKKVSYTYFTGMFYCILCVWRALMNSDPLRVWSWKQCFLVCFCFTNEAFQTTSFFYYVTLVYRRKAERHIEELLPMSYWKMPRCVDCMWMLNAAFSKSATHKHSWERECCF